MEKRLMTLLVGLFLLVGGVIAQTKVNGTVVSQDDGQPVIGATVLVVGTNVGAVTNASGQFSLTLPAGKSTLRVTYIGMKPQEVSARANMRIALVSNNKALDEVIVVAYGTQKKSSFTGSAQSISSEDMELRPISTATKALEGHVSGVQMTSASGQPGSSPKIRIRGFGSINASSAPLYVVDGIPYDGDLSSLNPADIESMTVLKDASSGALYGARGANGVVMITTKQGKEGKTNVTWRSNIGWSNRANKRYDNVSQKEFVQLVYESVRNDKWSKGASWEDAEAIARASLGGKLGGETYNPFKNYTWNTIINPATGQVPRTVTYTYVSDGMIEIEKDCDITVVSGEGIEVKGNKSPYQLGETATFEAVVGKNVEFGGWYDENNTLLSNTKKYEFVVTGSQTIYAINANVLDGTFDSDIPIDLDAEFGLTDATYTITNSDTEDKDEYVKGLYTFDNGGKYTIIAKDSDGSYKFFTVKITGGVERTYEWKCDNITYTLTMDIDYDDFLYSRDLYDISKRQQQSSHVRDKTFVTYSYTDSTMAPYMETLVNALYEKYMATHSTVTEIGYLNYILAFTQYIEYQYDEEAMGVEEYWKFPLETLYDQGGDCEDTSILFVAIAHQSRSIIGFNYEVAMQLLPGHMCGAIKLSGSSASYKTNPSGYIYCETTTTDYRIGEIPKSNNMEAYFTQATYYNNGYSATVEIA